MKKIQKLVEKIDEELCGAKDYAEDYVEQKAMGNMQRASVYKEMAQDELNHASNIHEIALKDIEELNRVFTAPEEMQAKWEESHKGYVEKAAWIRVMLQM